MELADDDENFAISGGISRLIPAECSGGTELILSLSDDSVSATSYNTSVPCCTGKIKIENILDKSISIDDDNLIAPLQPVKLSIKVNRKISSTIHRSVLRKNFDNESIYEGNSLMIKKVSFPAKIEELVSYREPENLNPFLISEQLTASEIVAAYENSCLKNNTIEIKCIKSQLSEIRNNSDCSANLKLINLHVTYEVLETIEDIFKLVNFKTLTLIDCIISPSDIAVFFDILEYYDCTVQFILSADLEQLDAWKLFCNFVGKVARLESLTLKSMNVSDVNMKSFMNSINANPNVKSICFDSCTLIKLPNFTLIEYLESNQAINELRLLQTGLYTREADIIGRLLRNNWNIQILDISNNLIGDRGLEHLAKGLCQQEGIPDGIGLSVLIAFNNQLSEKSGKTINSIISKCKNLRSLNVGFNNLTDTVIDDIAESLKRNSTLEGLGLQATLLTCKGAAVLAEAIKENKSLKKLNLKGNKAIYIEGLEKLSEALISSKISKIELDETNRSCADVEGYSEVVKKIKEICTINKSLVDQSDEEDLSQESLPDILSRKISLTCEPYYTTSLPLPTSQSQPQLSPINTNRFSTSSSVKSRFSVSKVIDFVSKPVDSSRFKVATVSTVDLKHYAVSNVAIAEEEYNDDDDDEDDEGDGQFQNVRGSVSSIDSVDTIDAVDSVSDTSMPACESE